MELDVLWLEKVYLKNLTWQEGFINWMGYSIFYPHKGIDLKI